MKLIFTVLFVLTFNSCDSNINVDKPKINFVITLRSAYSSLDNTGPYFIVEANIVNNGDSIIKFWGYNCSFVYNFDSDPSEYVLIGNNCDNNKPKLFTIQPNQILTTHLIIKKKPSNESSDRKLKLGFVLILDNQYNPNDPNLDYNEVAYKFRKKEQNLIWSNTIFLAIGGGQPTSIK